MASLSGGATASFQYDPLGRRTSKTINGTQTGFLYDGLTPVQELNGTTPTANLLTGLLIDEYLTRTDSTTTRAVLTEALSSTIALTDNGGTVQASYTYEPFGATSTTGTTSGNNFDDTGRENDGTGLKYYRARYQDPVRARFVSEDPLGLAAGDPNLYAYAFSSPVNFTDPTGEFVPQLVGCAIGGGVAYALGGRKVDVAIGCLLGAVGIPPAMRAAGAVTLSACARFPRPCLGVVSTAAGMAGDPHPANPSTKAPLRYCETATMR